MTRPSTCQRGWNIGSVRSEFKANGTFFYQVNSGSPSVSTTPAEVVTNDDLNKWTHFATIYDPENRQFSFYKNGALFHSSDVNAPKPSAVDLGIVIGAHNGLNGREFRSGYIDQCEVHAKSPFEAWFKASIEAEKKGSDFLTLSNFRGAWNSPSRSTSPASSTKSGGTWLARQLTTPSPSKASPTPRISRFACRLEHQ